MENQSFNFNDPVEIQNVSSEVMSKTFMTKVFSWMSLGLVITGVLAWYFATIPDLRSLLFTSTGATPLFYVAMFAPIGLVLLTSFAGDRLSYPATIGIFVLFSALFGMSLSIIFLVYTATSICSVFFITSGMFAAMALLGYTTSTDLTKLGSILYMLLFGVIIAMVVNLFMHSESFDYMISFVCVGIFTGLTAYKVQAIKRIGAQMTGNGDVVGKAAVFSALSLYITFVNLFLSLLRIFGSRR